jgi:transcriptional regulator with XRE-family HTH domain
VSAVRKPRKKQSNKKLGSYLKKLRVDKEMDQTTLAVVSDYSERYIRKVEKDGNPTINYLKTMAEIFDVKASEIVKKGEEDTDNKPEK